MFTNGCSLVKTQEVVQGHGRKWKEFRLRRLGKAMGRKVNKAEVHPT